MFPVKNWPMFIESAELVTQTCPHAFFLGVGGGELLSEMSARAKALGLYPNRLRFLGKRTDVSEILGVSDVLLFTSNSEGMPNAVLEAMSCGLPVVATRISGTKELVYDGQNGFLVPTCDAQAAADCILRLYKDRMLTQRMGAEGRRIIVENYSVERMAAMHEEVYRRTILRHRDNGSGFCVDRHAREANAESDG